MQPEDIKIWKIWNIYHNMPFSFAEGRHNTRLEYINDLPKGCCLWLFDQTDMAKAKEDIGHGYWIDVYSKGKSGSSWRGILGLGVL